MEDYDYDTPAWAEEWESEDRELLQQFAGDMEDDYSDDEEEW